MSARHTPATLAIQRRLERLELDHLRALAAEQAAQIDELQSRLEWAEDCAEHWRQHSLDLINDLGDDCAPGLTVDGRLVVIPAQARQ